MAALERLKLRIPEITDAVGDDLLKSAAAVILNRRYPFGDTPTFLDIRYEDLQIRIAVEMYNKQGAEGEIAHSENGVNRTYSSASVSEELLREIVPMCGGFS